MCVCARACVRACARVCLKQSARKKENRYPALVSLDKRSQLFCSIQAVDQHLLPFRMSVPVHRKERTVSPSKHRHSHWRRNKKNVIFQPKLIIKAHFHLETSLFLCKQHYLGTDIKITLHVVVSASPQFLNPFIPSGF